MIDKIVEALLPAAMPVFARSRWNGAEDALDYCGLAFSAHTIMQEVVPAWVRELSDKSNPVTSAEFADVVAIRPAAVLHGKFPANLAAWV